MLLLVKSRIVKQSLTTKPTLRCSAFQLWLKVNAPILAVVLGLTGITNSALASCSGSTVISTSVNQALVVSSVCDVSITSTGAI